MFCYEYVTTVTGKIREDADFGKIGCVAEKKARPCDHGLALAV
jgi:hypothetical protein